MVAVECSNVGLFTLFKAATLKGMSFHVFIFYAYTVGILVLLPLPFIFRGTALLPSFKFTLLFRIFLLGLTGFLSQIIGYKGIAYSNPTLASAISNLTPAFTFALAIIFRMEKLALRRSSTRAKIIGTLVSISGAMVAVLYKGPTVLSTPSSSPSNSIQLPLSSSPSDWVVGGTLTAAGFLLISVWYIIQTQVMKIYPAEPVVVFLYNLCATIISAPGILSSSLGTLVHTFVLRLKGPVYVVIFKPLSIAIAAILSFIFLNDALHLGSVIGSVVITMGFYAVIWGNAKEEGINNETVGFCRLGGGASSDSKINNSSLLQSLKAEDS